MLYRLTIQSRSPQELRQLARERRTLAASREDRLKSLLLQEAKLLESYAELRDWMEVSDRRVRQHASGASKVGLKAGLKEGPRGEAGPIAPAIGTGADLLASHVAARLALGPVDQQALFALAVPRHVLQDEHLSEEGETPSSLSIICSGIAKASRVLADGTEQ